VDTGIAIFATHYALDPANTARLVEQRGHSALLFPEHSHIPASRQSPYPGGGELPEKYKHTYDLFVTMTAAAAATTKLRVGSGVCLLMQRDPIHTAKAVASIDVLSGGRVEFGIGLGWNREEMADHGTDPRTRTALLRERVEAMRTIWTQDEASYAGKYVHFERIWSWPKPAQRPHPPIILGGNGPTVLDRVLDYADGWMPNYSGKGILDRARELRDRADRPIDLQIMGIPADPKVIEAYAEAGFSRAVHWVPSAGASVIEAELDKFEAAAAEVLGA
jgi:probable F420-dependent oxidoreductase